MTQKSTAVLYIDGFNLYRRRLDGRDHHKWLDLAKLAAFVLPDYDVIGIEYFTALLKYSTVEDTGTVLRQQIYLRALATIPSVRIHLGTFRADKRVMTVHPKTYDEISGDPRRITVIKVEEKGSDVNLASRMVADSLTNRCDVVVLLSNDSDQSGQVRLLTEEFSRRVGLVTPVLETKRASKELRKLSIEFFRVIPDQVLDESQLPLEMVDLHGTIRKPDAWGLNSEGPISGAF